MPRRASRLCCARRCGGEPEPLVTRISKDCFGTVISTLNKMKECVKCELLAECRSINWAASNGEAGPVVTRRPDPGRPEGDGTGVAGTPGADAPA